MPRFYFTNATSPLPSLGFYSAGSVAANWEINSGIRKLLATTKQGANAAATLAETGATASYDGCLVQFVSAPMLQAGNFVGVMDFMMAHNESNLAADMVTKMVVYIVSNDGSVIRGAAGALFYSLEWTTTLTAKNHNNTFATPVACQVGDRLVMEVGYRANNVVTTSYSGTMRYGGTDATDLVQNDTGTAATTRSGWADVLDPAVEALWTPPPSNSHFHALAAA